MSKYKNKVIVYNTLTNTYCGVCGSSRKEISLDYAKIKNKEYRKMMKGGL